MPEADPRRVAFDVLRAVEVDGAYANLELGRVLRERRLSGRDAALATELVSGTLRLRGRYDAVVDHLVDQRLDADVREVLRLGAHQLLGMRVPAHAAVATSVSLARHVAGHRPTRLVNAVLRRVAARDLEGWMTALDAPLATRASHPAWVVDALGEALDRPDEFESLLEADNTAPRVTLVARPGQATVEELGGRPLAISPYAAEMEGGDPGAIAAVREGRAGVQDAGSQVVAVALAAAQLEGRDVRWLDACAGPGGKAALLQGLAEQRGARLVAGERAPHRAALVRSAGVRRVVCADQTRPPWAPGTFDRVLVDAPCTGLGALRRRPEARWRREPGDVAALVRLQVALLASAVAVTRAGGVVAYATCSPVVAETAEVVRGVLDTTPSLTLLDVPALVPWIGDARAATMPEALQLWPHRHGTDAMFVALLRVGG